MSPSSALPFLHLSDALSLFLLLVGLMLLRQSAVEHLRIELARLRGETLGYWREARQAADEPALAALLGVIDAASEHAARMTPARLYFVGRAMRGLGRTVPDPIEALDRSIARLEVGPARSRLGQFRLELFLKLGAFYLLASLSGSFILVLTLTYMACRVVVRPGRDRGDRFVDFAEKLFSRVGRHALRLALATEPATTDGRLPLPDPNPGCTRS